jgi:uncharacterized protein
METPCINVCVIDQVTRLCAGCGRTIDEIAGWRTLSDGDRRRIMLELPERRKAMQPAGGE